jgi:anti-anti-sigma factor
LKPRAGAAVPATRALEARRRAAAEDRVPDAAVGSLAPWRIEIANCERDIPFRIAARGIGLSDIDAARGKPNVSAGMNIEAKASAPVSEARSAMRIFEIDQDMDHAGVSAMKALFDAAAQSPEDVCLDLAQVRFLDSAGVGQMVALGEALRRRSLGTTVIHAKGQPVRLMRQSLLNVTSAAEGTPRSSSRAEAAARRTA